MSGGLPTVPEGAGEAGARRRRGLRRVLFSLVALVPLLGLLGFLGPRNGDVSARAGDLELDVTYPRINRPGLAAKLSAEVRRPGLAQAPVTLAVDSSYLDALAEVTVDPEPMTSTADADRTIWTFEPPPDGDTLVVSVQGRIHPSGRIGRPAGTVAVLEDGTVAVSVRFRTWVVP